MGLFTGRQPDHMADEQHQLEADAHAATGSSAPRYLKKSPRQGPCTP